jgi:site-specific recombinase XerD
MLYGATLDAEVMDTGSKRPLLAGPVAITTFSRDPLLAQKTDFLEGDESAQDKVSTFLGGALAKKGNHAVSDALVPWMCDVLLSKHSLKAYGRDLVDFVRRMEVEGVGVREVRANHVKLYKRALLEAGMSRATLARKLSVLRGAYGELAAKGLVRWEVAQDIAAIKAPPVQKNSTPALTSREAVALLEAISESTLQGVRDLALMSVFFVTGCRVSAVVSACVGHLETDGVEHYLNVTEKRGKKRRKILLSAAGPVFAYLARAGIADDREGALFRPMSADGCSFLRRHLDRKTPWRLVKKYCRAAGIESARLGSRGIGVHSLRKTAINDAIRNGAQMHEVREFAGHSDIRTTELYFVRKEEDAETAARRIQIRMARRRISSGAREGGA